MLVLGTAVNVAIHFPTLTADIVLAGMISGLASIGGYEAVHQIVKERGNQMGTDGNGLEVRKKPSWSVKPVLYIKNTGAVFTVIKKVKVGSSYMYQIKSGMYITASDTYVEYYTK